MQWYFAFHYGRIIFLTYPRFPHISLRAFIAFEWSSINVCFSFSHPFFSFFLCSPKSNSTSTYEIIKRAFTLLSGMGLSINNKQIFCGDSIFSGHTTILFFGYLVLNQYSPKKIRLYLSVLALVNAIAGVIFILLSHMHYTIDVIIAYYLTTRWV